MSKRAGFVTAKLRDGILFCTSSTLAWPRIGKPMQALARAGSFHFLLETNRCPKYSRQFIIGSIAARDHTVLTSINKRIRKVIALTFTCNLRCMFSMFLTCDANGTFPGHGPDFETDSPLTTAPLLRGLGPAGDANMDLNKIVQMI